MINVTDIQVMKPLLISHGFHFSKAKGQNFLIASWVPQQIAEDAGVDETAGVLEIGPGIGPLTQQLCLRAKKVCAVELDERLKPILEMTVGEFDNLEILWNDVLKMNVRELVQEKFQGLRPMACANLPYYITSPILQALLDARRNLALRGKDIFRRVAKMADYARDEVNAIGGYYAFGKELINGDSVFDFDTTKLSIYTLDTGLAGIEVYDRLRDDYDIQIEFGDLCNILAYLSIGDRYQELERLVSALSDIYHTAKSEKRELESIEEYIPPIVAMSPTDAFYADKEKVPLEDAEGRICSEFVMCYPPGIPILAPGEMVTREILDYIVYAMDKGCSMTGPEDATLATLNVIKGE